MKKRVAAYLMSIVAFAAIASQVQALSFVSNRGALGGNDFIDWGAAGPDFTVLSSPFTIMTNNGLTMTVSTSNGTNMERRDQGSGWAGNFSPGDHLLWNQGGGGDIIIDFSMGISGFGGGAQVQSEFFGTFTGTISAFDENLTLLGSFMFNGNSTSNGDGSAVFGGVSDTTADIHRIVFSTDGVNSFAINQFDIVTVPEPATLSMMGLALIGFGVLRRFRRFARP